MEKHDEFRCFHTGHQGLTGLMSVKLMWTFIPPSFHLSLFCIVSGVWGQVEVKYLCFTVVFQANKPAKTIFKNNLRTVRILSDPLNEDLNILFFTHFWVTNQVKSKFDFRAFNVMGKYVSSRHLTHKAFLYVGYMWPVNWNKLPGWPDPVPHLKSWCFQKVAVQ